MACPCMDASTLFACDSMHSGTVRMMHSWAIAVQQHESDKLPYAECVLHAQVVREVAVLDNINPGGMYTTRVRMLGR